MTSYEKTEVPTAVKWFSVDFTLKSSPFQFIIQCFWPHFSFLSRFYRIAPKPVKIHTESPLPIAWLSSTASLSGCLVRRVEQLKFLHVDIRCKWMVRHFFHVHRPKMVVVAVFWMVLFFFFFFLNVVARIVRVNYPEAFFFIPIGYVSDFLILLDMILTFKNLLVLQMKWLWLSPISTSLIAVLKSRPWTSGDR
jgi:hypothetical protein